MKNLLLAFLLLGSFMLLTIACNEQKLDEKTSESKQSDSTNQASIDSIKNQAPKQEKPHSPESITDARDGTIYQTMVFGSQRWMIENLRYKVKGSWLNPDNPSVTYGRLYDWATTMNGASATTANPSNIQGICPEGWHIPSDMEWSSLEIALGMGVSDSAGIGYYRGSHGTDMKSTTGWRLNGDGSNESTFNALPAGSNKMGTFTILGDAAIFWSTTNTLYKGYAWSRCLLYPSRGVLRLDSNKEFGLSCRCVKD